MAISFNTFFISSFITFLVIVHFSLAYGQGFTTNLIHRDSPLSPLYNPSLNQYERLRNSIQRSMFRIDRFRTSSAFSPADAQSPIKSSNGDCLMELFYGTPLVSQLSIVDTGSDLIWIQCQPCLECYKQDIPIFDPLKSSTYMVQSCDSQACQALNKGQITCLGKGNCSYSYIYGDTSHTSGDLATDTITFNVEGSAKETSFPKVSFGCGHQNGGIFESDGSGLVGLGRGPLSLVSQLRSSICGKCLYCLIPYYKEGNYTSKISFGTIGEVSGPAILSTPIAKGDVDTFYYLTLNGISVETTKIPFYRKSSTNANNGTSTSKGNIIVDSGTTLTFLPFDMVSNLSSAMDAAIQGAMLQNPKGRADLNIPNVTAHFAGGDLVLKPSNTFVQVAEDVVCLAIVPADALLGLGILGNVAQMDILVVYDTEKGTVSFKPTNCTKEQY